MAKGVGRFGLLFLRACVVQGASHVIRNRIHTMMNGCAAVFLVKLQAS